MLISFGGLILLAVFLAVYLLVLLMFLYKYSFAVLASLVLFIIFNPFGVFLYPLKCSIRGFLYPGGAFIPVASNSFYWRF